METRVLSLATPPEVLKLQVGNTCQVIVYYDYRGPQVPAKIRVAIGRVGIFGFDEIVYKVVSITVPDTPQKTTYQTPVDIYISSAMTVQPGYDLYAKIVDIPGADIYSATYHDVIEIVAEAPPPPEPPPPPPGIIICPYCGAPVPEAEIQYHFEVCPVLHPPTPPPPGTVQCPYCGAFVSEAEIQYHFEVCPAL